MQRICTWLYNIYVQEELSRARIFLRREMGLDLGSGASNVPINFTKDEINMYVKRFKNLDSDNKGYITVNDLRRYFKVSPFCFVSRLINDNKHVTVSMYWVSKLLNNLSGFFYSCCACLLNRISFFFFNYTNNLWDLLNTPMFLIYIESGEWMCNNVFLNGLF